MTDITPLGFRNDVEFCEMLVKEVGVAAVPGSSFYSRPELGESQVRFCFCKKEKTLKEAIARLGRLREHW
jgi:aminotransferase